MTRFLIPSLVVCLALTAVAADGAGEQAKAYAERIHPLMVKTCGKCHGKEPKDNDLDLTSLVTAEALLAQPKVLEDIADRLNEGDMPPKKSPQPSLAERDQLLGWIGAAVDEAAAAHAGDPGSVTLRRLTNAEYDHSVRDLTGVDMQPTRAGEFAPDSVGGEGFANVGEAMPMTPGLVERYHQAARYVAARAVLLPTGFRFSTSPDGPDWTTEAEKALRNFHSRYAGPNGEPPLAAHLAATLKHRDRLTRGGAIAIAEVAAEEKLNATYLAALWAGLSGKPGATLPVAELDAQTKQWEEKAAQVEAEREQRQSALDSARQKIESRWAASKRVLVESKVAEAGSVPFEHKVSVRRGELLLLTVLPNQSHGADSTLIEWTIRETTGDQRSWSVADLIPDLLKSNPRPDKHGASWSFLETTSAPVFLTERRESIAERTELKSWSLGSEPSIFVNTAAEPLKVWTKLPARSVFLHPGPKRPVTVAWTSPIDAELVVSGRVADAHPSGGDGVAFELSHLSAPELGQALAGLGVKPAPLPTVGLPPDIMGLVREKWRAATTDPAPVLAAITAMQDRLFWSNYRRHNVLAVGNGVPAWVDMLRVVAREQVQGAAREPVFRLVARQVAPAQPGTFVVWDRLRLESGDGPTLVLAEHAELRAAVEAACGLRFGHHPQGRPVPPAALVTEAGSEVRIDLRKLPAPLLKSLTLPRFLRADVSLDAGSPETATVQALLLAEPDIMDAKQTREGRINPTSWRSGDPLIADEPEPRVAQIVHPRVAVERARPAAEFRALFPPAVLFEPIIPRDAQGSLFMFHREDEPLRRLLLDETGRAELERLWSELHFLREDAPANTLMYAELLKLYSQKGQAQMHFFIQTFEERLKRDDAALLADQAAAEPRHLDALLAFAARAWRRSLGDDERETILASYRADRAEGIKHDPALRAALARVLSSPWFLYRVEQPATGPRWQPVSGDELATRLSFLLWDSIPDDELRAASPRLHEPAVMEAQVRRMIKDSRTRGMAEEFGARWLGVRDFVANHGRSLKDFPEFTPAVRDALAEEPVRFFEDLLINDRAVSDVIATDAVIVNDVLAKHYGIPGVTGPEWRRVEKVAAYGRGGLLGLGAVLAKQSAAARTSPIKRGAWVAHMLGDRLPKPPPNVPPLPDAVPAGLSVRELTERHRKDANCAACHVRIDPYGMTLEQFDAIGRLRPASTMKPGESRATLRDGTDVHDFTGLRNYVAGPRREDLLRTLARKLTGYALSRTVLPSDRALVDEVSKTMTAGGRWSDALLVIVRSEPFRCIRPADGKVKSADNRTK
jgi:mono/diheme cytochrome c family protein